MILNVVQCQLVTVLHECLVMPVVITNVGEGDVYLLRFSLRFQFGCEAVPHFLREVFVLHIINPK